jgi:hypothetical protein
MNAVAGQQDPSLKIHIFSDEKKYSPKILLENGCYLDLSLT